MKMILSSTSSGNEKVSTSADNKSSSPTASPRNSPKLSPKPQHKRDQVKSDSYLTVNYKEQPVVVKHEGSPSSQDGSTTSSKVSSTEIGQLTDVSRPESTTSSKERKEPRGKKKSFWFNSFYPTYKSRSGDFKRIFKEVPYDERLVVDYSCALQKDILVQGRLYVTQNYLCFYANIFGWETNLTLKWKDVSAITKEKTAIVIPNAVLICTRNEKYFFTSFVTRDKTYLMLFRIWQNALMDQPMVPQEMWQWVHQCYGEELGLTSDDEDYIAPGTEEDKLSTRLSIDSFSEQECSSTVENSCETMINGSNRFQEGTGPKSMTDPCPTIPENRLQTDMSDTTESDGEKQTKENSCLPPLSSWEKSYLYIIPQIPDYDDTAPVLDNVKCDRVAQCTSNHEGRQLVNDVFSIHIDQLFTLLFTSSKFYLDFHAMRKTTDLTQTPWIHNPSDNSKSRIVSSTVAISQAMGPKTAQVTESQVMLPCSKPGILYAIDVDTIQGGVPYADSFSILVHFCLQKVSETESSITVFAQIKYKKSVWGLVKGMIEKSVWSGLEDFYSCMRKGLIRESEDNIPDVKRKSRRKRRLHSTARLSTEDSRSMSGAANKLKLSNKGIFNSEISTMIVFTVLILLVILNVMLYFKLWSLEDSAPSYNLFDIHVLTEPPKSHEEWIKLLQQQETLHTVEMQKWQRVLNTAIKLLKETEESLTQLQRSINPAYNSKLKSILQNYKEAKPTEEL